MTHSFEVPPDDPVQAGKASTEVKRILGKLGVAPSVIKRAAVAMYEAEMNMVIHAGGGRASMEILPGSLRIVMSDAGPGIPDLDLAMTEGFSTAPEWIREIGFGAGMGLPNMKRNADELVVDSVVGRGTTVTLVFRLDGGAPGDDS